MRKWAWAAFWLLGFTWGSSFMLIRIGVQEINPFQLVFIRVGIAAVGLLAICWARGLRIPFEREVLFPLILIGLGNTAIPFLLVSWSETVIESSLASILQSTTSLFALVIAHFAFEDERMSPQRVIGILAGFFGVMILFSGGIERGQLLTSSVLGMLGMVLSSLFYATFTTYSRAVIQRQINPMVVAAVAMSSAAIAMGVATFVSPLLGGPAPVSLFNTSPGVTASVLILGFFNTFLAYAMFYLIINQLGAARTAMVTYVVPFVGLALGVIFLDEPLSWSLIAGAALIVGGIGIVNLPVRRKPKVAVAGD